MPKVVNKKGPQKSGEKLMGTGRGQGGLSWRGGGGRKTDVCTGKNWKSGKQQKGTNNKGKIQVGDEVG